jgi:single-stranded-DNA-specific exonuclease
MYNHKILKISSPDTILSNKLSRELSISKVFAQVLINRGLSTIHEAEKFLKAGLGDLLDPYSFVDMANAVNIIKTAVKNKDRIMVFGDYDVDGITALSLLKNTLQKMGADVLHYLPHRIKEGYGLNKNILHLAKERGIRLLITVDCGTNSHEQIKELKKHNIEVIITDHHESSSYVPLIASAVINPKLKDSGYKYRDLAGVGVAYKLCQAITSKKLFDELDLVTLGTIADVVPLTGENRIIVKEGLSRLSSTNRPGIKALIETSRIKKDKRITPEFVSFILGPRINASGRMDTADISLDLLMSAEDDKAGELANIIEAHNRQRQKIEGKILEEAEDLIDREVNFKEQKIIVIAKEGWHQGVLGIVASKLADRFYRPTILISETSGLCKGSGRSIKNFHLFDALMECSEFLETFGGHSHATGLVIEKDKIGNFRDHINRLAKETLHIEDLLPSWDIDMELAFTDLNEELIGEFESLEPFGTGNPEPVFYARDLKLKGEPQVLSRDTIKFWVTDGTITHQAIGFRMSGLKDSLVQSDSFGLVYSLKLDSWNGEESIILEVKDIIFR